MAPDIASFVVSPGWLVLLGAGVGVLSGLLGVGGGVLITPALHILGMPMPAAVATSLTQMVGGSLSGAIKHYRMGNVSLKLAALYGLPSLLGITLGRQLLLSWPLDHADRILSAVYLGLMLYVCFDLLRKASRRVHRHRSPPAWTQFGPRLQLGEERSVALIPSMGAGTGVGLLSSLTGLGGGFLYIPAFTALAGCSIKQAIGTSLATMFLSSFYGAVVYGAAGVSHLPTALFLMFGSVVGAQLGAVAAQRAQNRGLEKYFLVLVVAAIVSMLLKRFGWVGSAHLVLFGCGGGIVGLALLTVLRRRA